MIAQIAEIFNSLGQLIELASGQRADLAAWSAAGVANAQSQAQFLKRESDLQGPPDQADSLDRVRRILAVTCFRPPGLHQYSDAFVVAERIGADAALASEVAGSKKLRIGMGRHFL
jgi:hypothetical protein